MNTEAMEKKLEDVSSEGLEGENPGPHAIEQAVLLHLHGDGERVIHERRVHLQNHAPCEKEFRRKTRNTKGKINSY